MRFSWVGAVNVLVTRCSFDEASHAVGSNLRSTTIGPAERVGERRERQRTRVVERAGGEVHLVRVQEAAARASSATTAPASVPVRIAPFGFPVVPDV